MTIRIPSDIHDEMINHALAEKPNEACGILGGKNGIVTKHYRMTNIEHSPESYLMDPKEQFAVVKDMRNNGIEMLAIYHSHPHSPARPSQKDTRMAFYENVLYIIISLKEKKPDIKAFHIRKQKAGKADLKFFVRL